MLNPLIVNKSFAGVDNGTSGAIAILRPDGSHRLEKMPLIEFGGKSHIDECALREILVVEESLPYTVFEQGQIQPKFGPKNNFTNGLTYGVVQTVLRLGAGPGLSIPYRGVNPKNWQDDVFKGIRGAAKDTKGVAIEFCRRTFPHINLVPPGCRVPFDGFADALCMAWWSKNFAFRV